MRFLMTTPADVKTSEPLREHLVEPTFEKRIMVVEDDPGLVHLYRILLHARGYRVLTAEDGEEAIKAYRRDGAGIDLMIVDLRLPKLDGIAMLARMKSAGMNPRVLVCSGVRKSEVERSLVTLGATHFLAKPFRNREMLDEVERALNAAAA
jgi:DNA-binding response OmpR family regulator